MEDEVGKYRKKKESSRSKSKYKAKHKHEYKDCLIRYYFHGYSNDPSVQIASYCTICGKLNHIANNTRRIFEKTENGCMRMLRNEEIIERNKDIPIFDIYDWCQKYVPLGDLNEGGD